MVMQRAELSLTPVPSQLDMATLHHENSRLKPLHTKLGETKICESARKNVLSIVCYMLDHVHDLRQHVASTQALATPCLLPVDIPWARIC